MADENFSPVKRALGLRNDVIEHTGKEPTELRGSREFLTRLTNEVIDGDPSSEYRGQMLEKFYGMKCIEEDLVDNLLGPVFQVK